MNSCDPIIKFMSPTFLLIKIFFSFEHEKVTIKSLSIYLSLSVMSSFVRRQRTIWRGRTRVIDFTGSGCRYLPR